LLAYYQLAIEQTQALRFTQLEESVHATQSSRTLLVLDGICVFVMYDMSFLDFLAGFFMLSWNYFTHGYILHMCSTV
jgi:hypothetical protein